MLTIGQLKNLIKDLNDDVPVIITIESGYSCLSSCNDINPNEVQMSDDPDDPGFCLYGVETSSQ